MMPDNWSFVIAAYALAALALGGYWRHLVRREKDLNQSGRETQPRVPRTGHPRTEPAARTPLQ